MRVFVTGDRGFIGAVLVPMLQRDGKSVVGLDLGLFDDCEFTPLATRYEQRTGDVLDISRRELEGFDAVVHLAGPANYRAGLSRKALDDAVHEATRRVATTAKDAGISRFVHVTAHDLIWPGMLNGVEMSLEAAADGTSWATDGPGPSHMEAEREILGLADSGFRPIFLKNAAPFGSSPRLRLDTFLNALIATAMTKDLTQVAVPGGDWRPFMHVKDIARAIIAALNAKTTAVSGGVFNMVRERDVTQLSAVLAQVAMITGVKLQMDDDALLPSEDTILAEHNATLPGFTTRLRLTDGIRELCRALSRNGVTAEDVDGPRFNRDRTLMDRLEAGQLSPAKFQANSMSVAK